MINSFADKKLTTKFIKYSQSFPIKSIEESVITYATAIIFSKK